MPVAMTYNSLLNDLRAYLERGATFATDPTVYEQLPNLVNLAERRLQRDIKVVGTISVVSSTMIDGTAVYAKPDRWRETVSMFAGVGTGNNTRKEIYPRSYEYCRSFWPNQTTTGEPRFYADYDYQHWLIVPTPDEAYPYEILYNEQPPYLDDNTQTNWFTEYAPDALLYGSLMEAQPFLKNEEMIGVWRDFYTIAISAINGEDLRQVVDRGIIRRED